MPSVVYKRILVDTVTLYIINELFDNDFKNKKKKKEKKLNIVKEKQRKSVSI